MSIGIIAKLFGFTKLPQWALELLVIGVIVLGIWMYHLHVVNISIAKGVAEQKTADEQASKELQQQTDQQSAAKLKAAMDAARVYAKEISTLTQYINDNELHGSLCQPAPHTGRQVVSTRSPPDSGGDRSAASAGNVQSVPSRDSSVGPPGAADVRGMLSLLAQRADELSARMRKIQARFKPAQ